MYWPDRSNFSAVASAKTNPLQAAVKSKTKALEAPIRQIAENAGIEGSIIVYKLKELDPGFGYNAATDEFVDMFKSGIVDPTKVTRSALQNAASISASFLTAEAAVVEIEKPQAVQAPSDMGGMGMM